MSLVMSRHRRYYRYRGQFQELSAGCAKALLGAVVLLLLAACDKRGDMPRPPHSPPRPVTLDSGHFFTAQMDLSVRPKPSPPGCM